MRLIFAGTPDFADAALSALAAAGHDVALVLTRPDKPAGRGRQLAASPVKARALSLGLPVAQPPTLRDAAAQSAIAAVGADVMVVAAYGLILPQPVLDAPRLGCLNIHASLLPRWRGAAPIQRAIEAGDTESGITIMQMDAGLDTGAMLMRGVLPIGPDETGGGLHDRLASLGATLIVDALAALGRGELVPRPQPAEGVTYAAKLDKRESAIDWRQPAMRIERRLRAFDPFPGSTTAVAGRDAAPIKIWRARAADPPEPRPVPGTVFRTADGGLGVTCGDGALELVELQKPGGRRLPAAEFQRGHPLAPGERFVLPEAGSGP